MNKQPNRNTSAPPARPDDGELASSSPVTPPQSAQPSLEEWIARYGGRARIPWAEWDRAVEAWKAERRAEFERKKVPVRMYSAALSMRSADQERQALPIAGTAKGRCRLHEGANGS